MKVREVNDAAELPTLCGDWERLLAQTSGASYFLSLDWLQVYWRHFGEPQKLRVIVVEEGGTATGIVPFVVRSHRSRLGSLNYLTYPLSYWGSFYGPLGRQPAATLAQALGHIRRMPRDWQVLELRWLPEQAIDGAVVAAGAARFPALVTPMDETSLVEFDGTWDRYLAARGSKFRNNLQRWRRRLESYGEPRFVRYRPRGEGAGETDPRWDLYDDCEAIAGNSWQAHADGTTLTSPHVRAAFRDWHAAAARRGAVDVNLLYLGGHPAAFVYNYRHGPDLYGMRVGYDAAIAKEGAGNLLYLHLIEDGFRRGDRRYDLGPGSIQAKRHIRTAQEGIYRLSHFPLLEPRAQLVRWRRWREARANRRPSARR